MSARMLVVDDDLGQLRMLARLIAMRRRDVTVLTASNGVEAVEVLESGPVDLLLTDLQMPDMNGFELLAWVNEEQPHVAAFSMTAYPDADAVGRLARLGQVECFTKPIDITKLFERMTGVLARGTRGQLHNIGLPSFLQMLEQERATCMLSVESEGQLGHLHLLDGQLVDAHCNGRGGRDAAVEVIAWETPAITIINTPSPTSRTIREPLGFLILEALRVEDEASRAPSLPPGFDQPWALATIPPAPPTPSSTPSPACVSERPPVLATDSKPLAAERPGYVCALAVVDAANGRSYASEGDWQALETLRQAASQLFEPGVQELVLTGGRTWLVAHPVSGGPAVPAEPELRLAILAFDSHCGSLVNARKVLRSFAADYLAGH